MFKVGIPGVDWLASKSHYHEVRLRAKEVLQFDFILLRWGEGREIAAYE